MTSFSPPFTCGAAQDKLPPTGKTGGVLLEKVLRGKIENDWVLCPRCKAKLGRLAYGGKAHGYIQKCDRCKSLVQIEVIG